MTRQASVLRKRRREQAKRARLWVITVLVMVFVLVVGPSLLPRNEPARVGPSSSVTRTP